MNKPEDFYRILQVHQLAEPEVIEGAYRKLAKKYHPDTNGNTGSEDMIKRINRAYETLRDPLRRRKYDLHLRARESRSEADPASSRDGDKRLFAAPGAVLEQYFGHLMHGRFDEAYQLITEIDRQNITYDDFISWRRAVSVVFQLKEYRMRAQKAFDNKPVGGRVFKQAAQFGVYVKEYNAVMDALEKNFVTKLVVLEGGVWRIFVGFDELQSIIDRFQGLTDLLAARSIIGELADRHSKIDALTGLLNQKGLYEKIESEIYRSKRYGSVLSFAMVTAEVRGPGSPEAEQTLLQHAVKAMGQILSTCLRKLDVAGRWDDMSFLILLPETTGASAEKAARKLYGKLKNIELVHGGNRYSLTMSIAHAEFKTSFEESLERLVKKLHR